MKLFGLSGIASRVFGFATLTTILAATLTACPSPSCALVLTPSTVNLNQLSAGNTATFGISSTNCSFSGPVSLSADVPAGNAYTVSFNPQSGTSATSQGTLTSTPYVPRQPILDILTVRATANGGTITANLKVMVTAYR
jgi:hypothetical protein